LQNLLSSFSISCPYKAWGNDCHQASMFSLKHNCKVFTSCPTSSLQPSLPHLETKVALLQVTCYCDNHYPNHWVPHAIVVHESSSSLTMGWGGEVWDCIFHADELNADFLNVWMTSLQICSCFGSLNANFLVHSFLVSTEIAWREIVGQYTVLNFLGLPRVLHSGCQIDVAYQLCVILLELFLWCDHIQTNTYLNI
jgi:hypothetical protein